MKIQNKTTIEYLIDRLKNSAYTEKIILCTTELKEDDILCEIATKNEIEFFRGSVPDKLQRWLGACEEFKIDFFVNADGDDLFFDAGLADLCFEQYITHDKSVDFIDGRGLYNDVYGIKKTALAKVCEMKSNEDTEFVRPYFIKPGIFECQRIQHIPSKYEKRDIRMTLDYQADLEFFTTIIEHHLKEDIPMTLENILKFLEDNPEVVQINWRYEQAWKDNQAKMIERLEEAS